MTAVAFDLDGCLIESRGAILPSVRVALVEHGLPALPDEDVAFLIGPPLETGFVELLTRLGADVDLAGDLVLAYRADYREHMLERTTVMPGLDGAVRAIAEIRGACVVTSKPAGFATPILEHLGLLDAFAFVEGPSFDVAGHETKTVTLGRALDRLEIGVMVGDRHHDVDAGRAHGLTTVGVLWGMGDATELAGADHVVGEPHELVSLLT
ncbi:MAG TPA: HAD hydrolase-like protein [Acidimicrobiales bacterium]|nr:HAD hydrolase-like protein [Acidimicrobiales bacterium]